MKKLTLSIVTIGLFSFTSCKKEYTCHCDTSSGGDQHEHIEASSKKKAEAACNDIASSKGYVKCEIDAD
jgi:hypothetical protein